MAKLRIGRSTAIMACILLIFFVSACAPSIDSRQNAKYFPAAAYAKYPADVRALLRTVDIEMDACTGHSGDVETLRACKRAYFANLDVWKRGWCSIITEPGLLENWSRCAPDARFPSDYAQRSDAEVANAFKGSDDSGSRAHYAQPVSLDELRSPPRPAIVPATPTRALAILREQGFSGSLDRNAKLRWLGRIGSVRGTFDFYALEKDGYYGRLDEALAVIGNSEKYLGYYTIDFLKCSIKSFNLRCTTSDGEESFHTNFYKGRLHGRIFLTKQPADFLK